MKTYTPPLAVSFVWNCADDGAVQPVLEVVRKSFARDREKPFSRGLNIPLSYFSSSNPNEVPERKPDETAATNITFVFTSQNTAGRNDWKQYVEGLTATASTHIVPIAIDKGGLHHNGSLNKLNCIRAYEWPFEDKHLHVIISLAHEIVRWQQPCGPNDETAGKEKSITIFLSHAKAGDTGRLHAEEIKTFIDNTNMNRFFDSTEISPGYKFDAEIESSIKESTLVAIESDAYSSRYWCQREILCAKKSDRPIVVVNSLSDYEDRIFPAASNVPCVHVSPDTPIRRSDILRVLSATILETVRHFHALSSLDSYREAGWISGECKSLARPPEIRQAIAAQNDVTKTFCYPEPPIYSEEADWHTGLGVEAFTPLWKPSQKDALKAHRVGISISEVHGDGFSRNNLHPDNLLRLAQDISRHLLSRSATLIYGGDLRRDGFTSFILDEAAILQDRLGTDIPKVENHLAWPLYVSETQIVEWRARYSQIMKTVEYPIPTDVASGIPADVFLLPTTTQNSYIWSRCLTQMREMSIANSTARICAGGKLHGYKGKMPGVLEEIAIALASGKPTFLMGAFGGVVGNVCDILLEERIPEELSEAWQATHNPGYADLQAFAHFHENGCNYQSIVENIQNLKISDLAASCGLEEREYAALMRSPFIDECVHLILKGVSKLSMTSS
jgi:hypothetical protein